MPLLSVTSVITGGSESATTPAAVVAVADSVLELTSVAPLRAVIEADAIDNSPSASPATALVPPATAATVVVLLASVVVAVVDSALVDLGVVSLIVVPTVVVGLSVVVVVVAVLGV